MSSRILAVAARRILAFLAAVVTLVILGSTAHSLFVQHAWLDAAAQSAFASGGTSDVALPASDRLSWILHDLIGMQPLYAGLTAIALLLGLLIAGTIARFTGRRLAIFALAGAACIFTLFTLLKVTLGTVGVFGARGSAGLAVQMAVGLTAALLFALLTPKRPAVR